MIIMFVYICEFGEGQITFHDQFRQKYRKCTDFFLPTDMVEHQEAAGASEWLPSFFWLLQ